MRSTGRWNEVRDQRLGFLEAANAKNTKANDIAFRVHALHQGVMRGFLFVTGGVQEAHFKEIRFRVEDQLTFVLLANLIS
jgi:hypothetical protein